MHEGHLHVTARQLRSPIGGSGLRRPRCAVDRVTVLRSPAVVGGVVDEGVGAGVGAGVQGGEHPAGGVLDGLGVSVAPGDLADAVGAGVQAEQPGEHVGDRLGLCLLHTAVGDVLLGCFVGVPEVTCPASCRAILAACAGPGPRRGPRGGCPRRWRTRRRRRGWARGTRSSRLGLGGVCDAVPRAG